MKSLELLPTDENILDTLYQDAFGRNTEIASFLNILTNIEGHFVISIDGKWGTGKTFFVKQCEMILDTINDSSKLISENKEKILHLSFLNGSPLTKKLKNQNCIYFDAWANDGYENPILAILNTLVNKASFIDRLSAIDKKDLIDAVVEMGKNYFSNKLGTSIDPIIKALKQPGKEETKAQISLHKYIEKIIGVFTREDHRLIIFVDELDRCKPSFAVKLLEQIKHYFLLENVTFVFSTNILELSKTISKFYGNDFQGDKYLNRFFDLFLTLMPIDIEKYYQYLSSQDSLAIYERNKLKVIKFLNMSMRDVGKFVTNNELIDYKNIKYDYLGQADEAILLHIEWLVIPFMIGLTVTNKEDEFNLIEGRNYELFKKFVIDADTFWSLLNMGGVHQQLNLLCDVDESLESDDVDQYKDKIVHTIYTKLFENPVSVTQVHSMSDKFWYDIKRIMDSVLHSHLK